MGVYIKGMEMPECCGYCPIEYKNYCMAKPSFKVEHAHRHWCCPLIEVPEPHGRLIDAGLLKETLDYYIREAGWSDEINKALSWVKDEFIDSEQSIIPASEEGEK